MKTKFFITIALCIFFSCKSKVDKNNSSNQKQDLEGEWELNYINYDQQKLQELYSHKIPRVKFDTKQDMVSGNNGCNAFSGKLDAHGNTIYFNGPMTATKMYCQGGGEHVFMETLGK